MKIFKKNSSDESYDPYDEQSSLSFESYEENVAGGCYGYEPEYTEVPRFLLKQEISFKTTQIEMIATLNSIP